MPINDLDRAPVDHSEILDRIYEIALEPEMLDDFINLWADKDMAAQFSSADGDPTGAFDASFKAHLERAEAFLRLSDPSVVELKDHLKPYEGFAAFIVNGLLNIEVANSGAHAVFGISSGVNLASLGVPSDIQSSLVSATKVVLRQPKCPEKLIKIENDTKQGATLFRVMRIEETGDSGPAALVVSTQIHWRETIGDILQHAFKLTKAEQGVVRNLTEGHDVKSIAATRGTAIGTVREQVKSIISKMNMRSQIDVVRFALILCEFSEAQTEGRDDSKTALDLLTSPDWLHAQVWKPFGSLTLPDGRVMKYHDMGPSNGNPILYSHMGSAMVRWSRQMIKLAFQHNLRIICPIRAGYGDSDNLSPDADVMDTTSKDTAFLLQHLGITKLPYAVHGSDFPFAAALVAKYPDLITEVIGIGARPCFAGGLTVEAPGKWQRFFVWTAQHNPKLVHFASRAIMMMSKRIGSDAMLAKLCKDSPADLALLEDEEVKQVLVANLDLMAGPTKDAARAFAMEYIAFHRDWSPLLQNMRHIPVHIFTADQDPTIDLNAVADLRRAYPWMTFEIVPDAGLAMLFQKPKRLIPMLAKAAQCDARILTEA